MTSIEICVLCEKPAEESSDAGRPGRLQVDCKRCGRFFLDDSIKLAFEQNVEGIPANYRLSAATRRAWEQLDPVTLHPDTLWSVAEEIVEPVGLLARLDRLIELLAERTSEYGEDSTFDPATDYPLGAFRSEDEVRELLSFGMNRRWLAVSPIRLLMEGWIRADELRVQRRDGRRVFVAMWFADGMAGVFEHGMRVGIERSKYFEAVRVDRVPHNDKICDRIIAELRRCSLVVADATGLRPNVFFEAGWAYGLGLDVIWTCRSDVIDEVSRAFDTRQYNHIKWSSPADLADLLDARIRATVLPLSAALRSS